MSYLPPRSAELAVRELLDGRDVDEVSRLVHNLIVEVTSLTMRVEALEAKVAGDTVVQADPTATAAALVKRMVG
jgi:hypothetical protein